MSQKKSCLVKKKKEKKKGKTKQLSHPQPKILKNEKKKKEKKRGNI